MTYTEGFEKNKDEVEDKKKEETEVIKTTATNLSEVKKHIETKENPPSKVEQLLINKGILFLAADGKLYLTKEGADKFIKSATILVDDIDILHAENVNPFGFVCIDGRYELPDGFDQMTCIEQAQAYPDAIPGGGAGMLVTLINAMIKTYGPDRKDMIEDVIMQTLAKNKEQNPQNYKIRRHTDTHSEDWEHKHNGEFSCGCGFLMKAFDKPEDGQVNAYGLTWWAIDFVQNILQNPERSSKADVLGQDDKNLKDHKERAAIITSFDDKTEDYFIIDKHADFSSVLTKEELDELSADDKAELNQMVFTANFETAHLKIADLTKTANDVIAANPDYANISTNPDQTLSNQMNNTIVEFTTQIKQKLSPNSPVVIMNANKTEANIIEYKNNESR